MNNKYTYTAWTGLFTLSLRLVIGWTYFSAFWRRVVLEDKLLPDAAGYIGEKFNHFLPNALFIQPIIEYLVTHPSQLHLSMIIFTIVEAIVGLLLMLGLFTRLMSVGVFLLAMGILLGSGWLGTTCLDEWQIGVLGLAGGFTLFLTGSGFYSLDYYLVKQGYAFTKKKYFTYLASGEWYFTYLKPFVLFTSLFILGITLYTNQYFHGGVWGTLHNKSVKPKVVMNHLKIQDNQLSFEVYRTEGADVYGSFLIEVQLLDKQGEVLQKWDMTYLSKMSQSHIHNYYVAKVKPGKYSLVLPLGAKALLQFPINSTSAIQAYELKLIDISGTEWRAFVKK